MDNSKPRTYWEHSDFSQPYQMGLEIHRNYILNKLAELEVHTLLDVGCGTGPIYEMLINQDDTHHPWDNIIAYKGVDYSRTMIETCKKLFPHGEFAVEDARFLNEASNEWECVLLMHCLDHLDDYQSAIREAVRVSSKYIVICLWRSFINEGTNLNDRNMYGKKEGEEPWQDTYLQDYSKDTLAKEFDKYGLIDIDFQDGSEVNEKGEHNIVWILKKP